MVSLSGRLFTNRTIPVSRENQDAPQFVTIDGLDLGRVRYVVTISARTGAGRGPETEAVAIGTQAPGVSVQITPRVVYVVFGSPNERFMGN